MTLRETLLFRIEQHGLRCFYEVSFSGGPLEGTYVCTSYVVPQFYGCCSEICAMFIPPSVRRVDAMPPTPHPTIEINDHQPPFRTPDHSDTFLTRNGFCHSAEFGVIVDPTRSLVGNELVYEPPTIIRSYFQDLSSNRLHEDVEWSHAIESSFELTETEIEHVIQRYRESTLSAFENCEDDVNLEYQGNRSYSMPVDSSGSSINWREFFVDIIERYRRDVTHSIPDRALYRVFEDSLEDSITCAYEEADRVVLEPVANWRLRALTLYQASDSATVTQCKVTALSEDGRTDTEIVARLDCDPHQIPEQHQRR